MIMTKEKEKALKETVEMLEKKGFKETEKYVFENTKKKKKEPTRDLFGFRQELK